jgi:GcrA cell cycle regulator
MSPFWTEQKLATLKTMLLQGRTLEQVGEVVGMTRHGIKHQADKLGLRSSHSASQWPPERIDRLKALFAEGYSGGAIAYELGVTRNSVIGKLHRLGLTRANGVERPPANKGQRVIRKKSAPSVRLVPVLPCAAVVDVVPLHVSLFDLQRGQCRFPYGDGPFTFCGCEAAPGKSYCEPHHRLTHLEVRMSPEEFVQHKRAFRAKMIAEAA